MIRGHDTEKGSARGGIGNEGAKTDVAKHPDKARNRMPEKRITVALGGNPNSGKTTLFNAITGAHHKVGNYPGVTVEKKVGIKKYKNYTLEIVDLPGTYSLTAYSLDEVVARDFVITEKPDVIINVLDATNLERNLFLCLQFQELGVPIVGALNMIDQAEASGLVIDETQLSRLFQIPMVKTVGTTGKNVDALLDNAIALYEEGERPKSTVRYGDEVEEEVRKVARLLEKDALFTEKYSPHFIGVKLLEKDAHANACIIGHSEQDAIEETVARSIAWLENHFGQDAEIIVSEQRYGYIHGAVAETVKRPLITKETFTAMVDKVVINRFLGVPIFFLILWGIFQLTFTIGEYPLSWLEMFFGWLAGVVAQTLPEGAIRSLIVDGIIGGVGGVFSFVPLIVILFLLISVLEDSGYMARAAYIMDKFLHIFGLHGQSFLPMMLGFGCTVPAVMGARTLRSEKDRIVTILILPFMSCGAKLPVYVLFASAFFPEQSGNVVLALYVIGIVIALLSAKLFRRTILKGVTTPFVMELPPYRLPTARGILWHVWNKTWSYMKKAGTIILLASVIIWAITSFPKTNVAPDEREALRLSYYHTVDREDVRNEVLNVAEGRVSLNAYTHDDEQQVLSAASNAYATNPHALSGEVERLLFLRSTWHAERKIAERALSGSIAGHIGKALEPILRPIGFDWKLGVSAITGLVAKEVVVSTLAVFYHVEAEGGEEGASLRNALRRDPAFTPLLAFVVMIFTLTMSPCFAALGAIRAELGGRWLLFTVAYTMGVAWFLSFAVFQAGTLLGLGG